MFKSTRRTIKRWPFLYPTLEPPQVWIAHMAGQGIGPDLQNVKIEANSMWDPKMRLEPLRPLGSSRDFQVFFGLIAQDTRVRGLGCSRLSWSEDTSQVVCSMLSWRGEGRVARSEGQDFCCGGSSSVLSSSLV